MKPSTLLPFLPLATSSALSHLHPSPTPLPHSWSQPIPPALQDFIAAFNAPDNKASPADNADLRKRQHGIGGAAPESTTSIATQMSPVTTYFLNGSPVVFTQTFAPTPDPWSGPVNGQIGLGTIQGTVGTVRSDE